MVIVEVKDGNDTSIFTNKFWRIVGNRMVKVDCHDDQFFPHKNTKIVAKIENGETRYLITIRDKILCTIRPNSEDSPYMIELAEPGKPDYITIFEYLFSYVLDEMSLQPVALTFDAESISEGIILRLDRIDENGKVLSSTFRVTNARSLKAYIANMRVNEMVYRNYIEEGIFEDYYVKHEDLKISPDMDKLTIEALFYSRILCARIHIKTFMHIYFFIPPVGGFYNALSSPLSGIGEDQLRTLIEYIESLYEICKNQTVYAPFTSLIQSSGFGKTKFCLELLQRSPGVYAVFRRSTDTGIPAMSSWMENMKTFVLSADNDLFPEEVEQNGIDKLFLKSTIGRFIYAIYVMIEHYIQLYSALFEVFKVKRSDFEHSEIDKFVVRIIGSQFMKDPSSGPSLFNPKFDRSAITFISISDIVAKMQEILMGFQNKYRPNQDSFTFLLFLDELEVMTENIKPGRSSAVHIVRRALHILNNQVSVLMIAVGTNSDALDFTPAVKDNSLRVMNRTKLLSPLPLTGSFDLLRTLINYHKVSLTYDDLRNMALFNVLVSLGRALWSSCSLKSVVEIAMTKIKNGDHTCMGSRISLLLMRADLTVNTHHVLARNLIRSYMSIVGYISSDAQDIKIGYSSEPVLAMAARTLLKTQSVRTDALFALKEFLERGAVDKGRVVETLFEYITLFAIDDAKSSIKLVDEPENVPAEFLPLSTCKSHILEIVEQQQPQETIDSEVKQILEDFEKKRCPKEEAAASQPSSVLPRSIIDSSHKYSEIDYSLSKSTHYSVKSVADYLRSLLGNDRYNSVAEMIDYNVRNGLVNCSHFLQLEKLRKGDFLGLENAPDQKSMKKNIIDKALLTYGIQRQCGFVMPPNYFGIDFLIPFVFKNKDARTIYSFIGIQSKTSQENIYVCAAKMSVNLHYCVCANSSHVQKGVDCFPKDRDQGKQREMNKNSCTCLEDYREMCENQLSILLIAEEFSRKTSKACLDFALKETPLSTTTSISSVPSTSTSSTTTSTSTSSGLSTSTSSTSLATPSAVSFQSAPTSSRKRPQSSSIPQKSSTESPPSIPPRFKEPLEKASIMKTTKNDVDSYRLDIEHSAYPSILEKSPSPNPDAIITKTIDSNLCAVQFLWNYIENDALNDVTIKDFLPPSAPEPKIKKTKKAKVPESETIMRIKESGPVSEKSVESATSSISKMSIASSSDPKLRIGTCIVCNGMSSYSHLFDKNGINLLKYILDFEKSSFHNVDMLHLPMVQNSILNGKACPYYDANPIIRGMRNARPLSDPTTGFKKHFNYDSWEKSIQRCIEGPVDRKVPSIDFVYDEKDPFESCHYHEEDEEEYEEEAEEGEKEREH